MDQALLHDHDMNMDRNVYIFLPPEFSLYPIQPLTYRYVLNLLLKTKSGCIKVISFMEQKC